MNIRRLSVLALVAAMPLAWAAPVFKPGTVIHTGLGPYSCGEYLAGGEGAQLARAWLLGYLSGVNLYAGVDVDFLHETDAYSFWAWMSNYCQNHPLDRIGDAVEPLVNELIARAKKNRPAGGK